MRLRSVASRSPRALDQRGLSLAEMLVASAVFLLVILAAYQVFQRSNESYQQGQNQAELVQNARVAFDQLVNDIRQGGYEFDVDGELTTYPNQPDEPLEYMHFRALIVRANFDFDKELKGREPGLEQTDDITACCPVVTTGNDEIVGYALGKPQGTTQPSGTITARFDTSGTQSAGDNSGRDGYVVKTGATAGTLMNEENISVSGFELGSPDNPPYTLYRFTFNDDGTVNKQPLIDNVRNLELTYYDEADNVVVGRVNSTTVTAGTQADWGDDNGQDKQAGRLKRWGIRRVRVLIQTMTPERDLRLLSANNAPGADVENYDGKRLFRLEEDIVPPNFGRRGQTDRDILPPEPVRDVQVCTGECGFVRVSWVPGPPEDKISDHLIILCDGPCNSSLSNRLGTYVVIANYDATTEPDREYAIITKEDASSLTPGKVVGAAVIARNQAGTESECPVADCPECCVSQSTGTVKTEARLDTFYGGTATGYDSTDSSWPDAKPDNASGSQIVTDSMSLTYPAANSITVTLRSPLYALNKVSGAGPTPYNWTTKALGSGPTSALDCHQEESTPDDSSDDPAYRTPLANISRDPQIPNVYVFRVSAHDSWNWGSGVTEPRNFVPGPDNLHDFVHLDLTNDTVSYVDGADTNWFQPTGRANQYDDRFDGTAQNFVNASGGSRPISRPPRALTPGEIYYYRFRAVDLCWLDKPPDSNTPSNGVNDENSSRTAWAVSKDFVNDNTWRQNSMNISPFYPPLRDNGDSQGERDRPDQSVNDSDNYPSGSNPLDTYALPGYAIPARTTDGTAYVPPEKPTELYLAKVNDAGTDFIDVGSPSKKDARVVFNAARRNFPSEAGVDPAEATYTRYRLYRKRASNMSPTGAEMAFDKSTATQFLEFTTKGQRATYNFTMDGANRGGPTAATGTPNTYAALQDIGTLSYPGDCPNSGENDGSACYPWIYRLATVQCSNAVLDDGIDTSAAEESALSRPFAFPCQFYDLVEKVEVSPETPNTPPANVTAKVNMRDDSDDPDPGCDGNPGDPNDTELKSARLLAYRGDGPYSGDYLGTSDWQATTSGSCDVPFNQTAIDQARREYGGKIRFVVELSDRNNAGAPTDSSSAGCRVRSDLPGDSGADLGVKLLGCAEECGGNGGSANVFRGTGGGDPAIETELVGDNTIRVTIPKVAACDTPFTLYQLEFAFENVATSTEFPAFESGQIVGGIVGGTKELPDPSATGDPGDPTIGDGDINESALDYFNGKARFRFYEGFCSPDGTCSYPQVRSGTDPLVVDITFDGPACDLKLTEFNFRVAVDFNNDGSADEMLCTRRGETGTTADPDPPTGAGQINPGAGGTGRGPAAAPAESCTSCTTQCAACQCPINDEDGTGGMDRDPDIDVGVDSATGFTTVTFTFNADGCEADCDFDVATFTLDIWCRPPDRDCGTDPLPKLAEGAPAEFIQDGTSVALDPPSVDPFGEEGRNYKWTNPTDVAIAPGSEFQFKLFFDGSMNGIDVKNLRLDIGAPLPFACKPDGSPGAGPTSCNQVEPALPLD